MAAGGYPGTYDKGQVIHGLDSEFAEHVKVFHAGTQLADDSVVTSGGRVLCVCALGANVSSAQADAYRACDQIHWEGAYRRNDIGYRAIQREHDLGVS
jgi:phosphoribosylamine--glycine ligase